MKRRELLKSLGMAMLFAAAGNRAEAITEPYHPYPLLRVGQSFRYDKRLKVTFVGVRKDKRCPENARCISAGDAKILLRVRVGRKPAMLVRLHTNEHPRALVIPAKNLPEGFVGIPSSYVVKVEDLAPGRIEGKKLNQSYYRLRLSIYMTA